MNTVFINSVYVGASCRSSIDRLSAMNPNLQTAIAASGSTRQSPLTVLVVDDQVAVREGLVRLISCGGIPLHAIGTAATCAEALSAATKLRPEVIVLDADLNGEDGLALIPHLSGIAGVLVLTCHGDPMTRSRAIRLGARAFLEKHVPAAQLLSMIADIGHHQIREDKDPTPAGTRSYQQLTSESDARSEIG